MADRERTDAFRFHPKRSAFIVAATGALGLFAMAAVLLDLGNARDEGPPLVILLAGGFLVLLALGLFWLARRRPVLLRIGPEGLDLPMALAHPLAWAEIWRIQHIRVRVRAWRKVGMLKVDLARDVYPNYKRSLWTFPLFDSWIARKLGLRIPLYYLDASEDAIIASVERFKPVRREKK